VGDGVEVQRRRCVDGEGAGEVPPTTGAVKAWSPAMAVLASSVARSIRRSAKKHDVADTDTFREKRGQGLVITASIQFDRQAVDLKSGF
jgi:hypothetical protein